MQLSISRHGSRSRALIATTALALGGLTPAGLLAPARAADPARPTFSPPASVATNCSVDVTGPLQTFVNGVPDRAIVSFKPGACYRIDGTLQVRDRVGLTLEGNGATFKAVTDGDLNRRHLLFTRGSNLVVRNLIVRGANPYAGMGDAAYRPDRAFQHAFTLQGVDGARLENVQAYDVYGDFVYMGDDSGTWSHNIEVIGSRFERNGRQGIAITGAHDVNIEGNYMGDVRRTTIDIEPNNGTGGARRIRIANNDFGPGRLLFLSAEGAGGVVQDVSVTGNRLQKLYMSVRTPSGAPRRARFTVTDNTGTASNVTRWGLIFDDIDGVSVQNNSAPWAPQKRAIAVAVSDTTAVAVDHNTFKGAAQALNAERSVVVSNTGNVT